MIPCDSCFWYHLVLNGFWIIQHIARICKTSIVCVSALFQIIWYNLTKRILYFILHHTTFLLPGVGMILDYFGSVCGSNVYRLGLIGLDGLDAMNYSNYRFAAGWIGTKKIYYVLGSQSLCMCLFFQPVLIGWEHFSIVNLRGVTWACDTGVCPSCFELTINLHEVQIASDRLI